MFLNSSHDKIPTCMHILWMFMPQTAGKEGRGGEGGDREEVEQSGEEERGQGGRGG